MQLVNILKQKSEDNSLKLYAVEYMNSTGSFTYSYEKLDSLIVEARSMIEELDVVMGRSTGMHGFLEFLELH